MSDKVKIREKALKIRKNLTPDERARKSRLIAENLESFEVFEKAQYVLFYYTHNDEVDTVELMEKYLGEKEIYLPVIRGKSHFQAVPLKSISDLRKGHEGVPEPVETDPNPVFDEQIELTITPGVAFDRKGNRLGTGKGYYDRYFQSFPNSVKVALAYEEQVLDNVPKDTYDVSIDFIITDQNIYECHKNI